MPLRSVPPRLQVQVQVPLSRARSRALRGHQVSATNPVPTPPTSGQNGVRDHANSICAFSGLNDLDPEQGPTDTIVQTPGHFMLAGLTPPGVPGHGTNIPGFENGCRGGSN